MAFQAGSHMLDFLMLAVLQWNDTYGYVLTQWAKELMNISNSTLYPVLRRLEKEGMLTTYDQPFQGRNRRYYHLTDGGRALLLNYKEEWGRYKARVDQILAGAGSAIQRPGDPAAESGKDEIL